MQIRNILIFTNRIISTEYSNTR